MISPVVAATECIPSRKAKASAGLILKTNGIIERERRRAADAGKQADAKAERHADQHQAEGFPLQNQQETFDERVEHFLIATPISAD